jgi:hypothetical protein
VTLTTAALCLLLGLTGTDDAPSSATLTPQDELREDTGPTTTAAPPDAVNFDALPELPRVSDDARVKRFLGALAGGVVGLGATLAFMPLADVPCFGFGLSGCVSAGQGILGTVAPLVSAVGALVGFNLMGGEGGFVTPFASVVPAALAALLLSNIARDAGAEASLALVPYLIASGVFLVGGSALALDLRARQLGELGGAAGWAQAPAGRVGVISLVGTLTIAASTALTVLTAALCRDPACMAIPVTVGASLLVASAASVWGVHRAMGGRGSFLSALLAMGAGTAATFGGVGLFLLSQSSTTFGGPRNTASTILAFELGAICALFLPALALEWSHANTVRASLPSFSFSAAPTPSGAMVAGAMRF